MKSSWYQYTIREKPFQKGKFQEERLFLLEYYDREDLMQGKKLMCPVLVTEEEKWFVATDIDSGVATQGKTIESAMNSLKEALELYYEDAPVPDDNKRVFLTTMEVCV